MRPRRTLGSDALPNENIVGLRSQFFSALTTLGYDSRNMLREQE